MAGSDLLHHAPPDWRSEHLVHQMHLAPKSSKLQEMCYFAQVIVGACHLLNPDLPYDLLPLFGDWRLMFSLYPSHNSVQSAFYMRFQTHVIERAVVHRSPLMYWFLQY
ncbi:hypothetical protein D3C79_990290 [compost metagenome]